MNKTGCSEYEYCELYNEDGKPDLRCEACDNYKPIREMRKVWRNE